LFLSPALGNEKYTFTRNKLNWTCHQDDPRLPTIIPGPADQEIPWGSGAPPAMAPPWEF
jgi:hypothetical protein